RKPASQGPDPPDYSQDRADGGSESATQDEDRSAHEAGWRGRGGVRPFLASLLLALGALVWPAWLDPAYIFFSVVYSTAFRDGFYLNNPNQAAVHKRIFDRLHNLGRLDLLAEPSVHLRPRHAPVLMDVPPHRLQGTFPGVCAHHLV